MTWNLWWRFGPWEARQPAIQAELAAVGADIVLLQEVFADREGDEGEGRDQAAELAEHLGFSMARTTDAAGQPHRFGNAVLSRWPIVDRETVPLPDRDGGPPRRCALAARVQTPRGVQPVVVTHLAWQYDASPLRQDQLEVVVDLVLRHRSDDPAAPPPILGGDFNAVPDSDEIRRLTGRSSPVRPGIVFTDCWEAVGEGPGHTWSRDNPNADQAMWPRRRLDYVFVAWPRPKPLANPLSARLAGVDAHDGIVPSDHYAVVVELDDRQT